MMKLFLTNLQTLLEMYHIQKKADVQVNDHFPVVCSVCLQGNKYIVSRCLECEEYLCESCQTAHKGKPFNYDYRVNSVECVELCRVEFSSIEDWAG